MKQDANIRYTKVVFNALHAENFLPWYAISQSVLFTYSRYVTGIRKERVDVFTNCRASLGPEEQTVARCDIAGASLKCVR
jgi:hypothetical protein